MKKFDVFYKNGDIEYLVTIEETSIFNEKYLGSLITVYPSAYATTKWLIPIDEPLAQILDTGNGIVFLKNEYVKDAEINYADIETLEIALKMSRYPDIPTTFKVVDHDDIKKI